MSWRVLEFSTDAHYLHKERGFLAVNLGDKLVTEVPFDDIAAILAVHPRTVVSQALLLELAEVPSSTSARATSVLVGGHDARRARLASAALGGHSGTRRDRDGGRRQPGAMTSGTPLSPYRIMWVLVMFDLPVMTDAQRKHASGFRNELLDRGYMMAQFSIYMRHCPSPEAAEAAVALLKKLVPREGKVNVLAITDRQYERMETFYGGRPAAKCKKPEQFELF